MMTVIFIGGLLFGFGLAYSTMTKPEVILNFLTLNDYGLLLVMAGAILVTMLTYQLAPRLLKKPLHAKEFGKNTTTLNKKTIIGAAIFGTGWGIAGLCPGAAIASLGTGNLPVIVGILAMFVGAYVQGKIWES